MKASWIVALLVVVLIGCDKPGKPYQAAAPQPSPIVSTVPPPPPPSATVPGDVKTPAPEVKPQETSSGVDVPKNLQNDAYHYYGMANRDTKNYRVQFSGQSHDTGMEKISLSVSSADPSKVQFVEQDSGAPMPATTQTMSLDDKGIYVDSISPQKLNTPHFLELPANLAPGVTWTSDQSVDSNSDSLSQNLTYKVVGDRPVTTPAGRFTARYIVGTGTGTLGANPSKMKVESWFVKDVGLVKQVASITGKGVRSIFEQDLQK